jgi:hypothetical protein
MAAERPRVSKAEAERLIGAVETADQDVLREVLARVLRRTTGSAATGWRALVGDAADAGGWADTRRHAVAEGELDALERLAVDLNELRGIRVDD